MSLDTLGSSALVGLTPRFSRPQRPSHTDQVQAAQRDVQGLDAMLLHLLAKPLGDELRSVVRAQVTRLAVLREQFRDHRGSVVRVGSLGLMHQQGFAKELIHHRWVPKQPSVACRLVVSEIPGPSMAQGCFVTGFASRANQNDVNATAGTRHGLRPSYEQDHTGLEGAEWLGVIKDVMTQPRRPVGTKRCPMPYDCA